VLRALLDAYRAAGADLPFSDPGRAHGIGMEGYYWRFVEPGAGRAVVALCGACRTAGGEPWALVALAAHPGGHVRHAVVRGGVLLGRERFGVVAGGALAGDAERVALRVPGAELDVRLRDAVPWPRRALGGLGLAHAIPGLPQYWHPVVLGGRADGELRLDGERLELRGATPYAEKNWGRAFARRWWWGHAGSFEDERVTVAFAGGELRAGRLAATPTALVVRLGDELARLVPPAALVRASAARGEWRVAARGPGWRATLEGEGGGEPHALPVPDAASGRLRAGASQHLAGRVRLVVRRGGRIAFAGESPLAGLERGELGPP
jgi:hypothetical protein